MTPKRSAGRPPKPARLLAAGTRAGMRRFSIELPEHLLVELDERAERNERSRNAEIRVLLGGIVDGEKSARPLDECTAREHTYWASKRARPRGSTT